MKKIRVFVIEDNRVLREGISAMITAQKGFTVVAVSDGGNDPLSKIRRVKPDIVLIDIGLQARNGADIVTYIRKEFPVMKSVVMGLVTSQEDILEFVKAGASGFILKEATVNEFARTLRSVARGIKFLPPTLTQSLFSQVVEYALQKGERKLSAAVRMTRREKEIVLLIGEGLSNKEIAQKLNIATFTVKSHVHNILEKLALRSRLQVSRYLHNQDGL